MFPRMITGIGCSAMVLVALFGCTGGVNWDPFSLFGKDEIPPQLPPEPLTETDAVRRGAVGELALLGNAGPQLLKGFGLVVGLEGSGSRECASSIREYLTDRLRKDMANEKLYPAWANVPVDDLISSPDTAVVELTAYVPPGAPRGNRIDVLLTAARGTETQSLVGGLLLPAELKRFGASGGGKGIIAGRTLGFAAGPVFVSPFSDRSRGAPMSDPRQALVLGGGVTTQERPMQLLLKAPSYPVASKIEQRLNETFGHREPPVAEAMSRSYLFLRTPLAWRDSPERVSDVAAYVFMGNGPAEIDARLRTLDAYARGENVDFNALSLAWEALGKNSLPHARPYYRDADPRLAFYAARVGVRLSDPSAVQSMCDIAATPNHPLRISAIRELQQSSMASSAARLVQLLSDPAIDVRVAAYEALLSRKHRLIESYSFAHRLDPAHTSFVLDLVPGSAPPFVHIRRTRAPRIAVFGLDAPLLGSLFYRSEDGKVVVNAHVGEETVTIFAQVVAGARREQLSASRSVVDLIATLGGRPLRRDGGRLAGAGLSYDRVARVLQSLGESGALAAPVVFERESLRELSSPDDRGRPEGDEPSLQEYEAQVSEADLLTPGPRPE